MKINDFSLPRRMSKSAFIIIWAQTLMTILKLIVIFGIISIINKEGVDMKDAFVKVLLISIGIIAYSAIYAAINYYFKKFYVENGNLIFIHGIFNKETKSIPLQKIQSLRTKQGLIYRLLNMRGISVDTLASKGSEIELILDEYDWRLLIDKIETGNTQENLPSETTIKEQVATLHFSNQNLLKGAFCQNHLKGMIILLSLATALFDQIRSVNEALFDSIENYITSLVLSTSFTATIVIAIIVPVYMAILILWICKVFLQYYDMNLSIKTDQLTFEYGLITRNTAKFSFDKISTVKVKQNFLEKWFGCSTIMLKQALNATDEEKGSDIKIYGSNSSSNFLKWWLGENFTSSETIASAKSGLGVFAYTVRFDIIITTIACCIIFSFDLYFLVGLLAIYIITSIIKGYLAIKRSSITLKEEYVEISCGKLAEVKNYCKYSNIEVVRLRHTIFTPFYHKVILSISTNGTVFNIRSLEEKEARKIYELLLYKI